jgi:protein involved in polysaccharide export with SLBB domain
LRLPRFKANMQDVVTGIRWAGMVCGLMLFCGISASGQQDQSFPSTRDGGVYQDDASKDVNPEPPANAGESEPVALSAERIIDDLRRQPELIPYVKQLADQSDANQVESGRTEAEQTETSRSGSGQTKSGQVSGDRYGADQGVATPGAELTDEALFQRIEQDGEFRLQVTEEMKTHGYLSRSDLDYLANPMQPEDGSQLPPEINTAPRLRRTGPPTSHRLKIQSDQTRLPQDQNQPLTTQKPNPFPSLPSLQDLYRQIPGQKAQLKRFGMDVFHNGSGNLERLPMDLPAGPDYVLGPGDGVSINLRGSVSRSMAKTIDREGRIALPEAGAVALAGQTVAQAQELIQKTLDTQFRKVQVDVSLTRLRTIRIYVVGDVERPGAYDISALSTPLNALYMAGGPTMRGSLRAVRLYRGERLVREVDLYDLLLQGVRTSAERMEPGDTILIPPIGPQVAVAGMVRRPAIYELSSEKELAGVLQIAGGVLVSANMSQISVERIEAHERRVMLKVNLPAAGGADSLNQALKGFQVQDGDYVTISPILPYSSQTVYLNGHVFRPGKYPFHPGMQISELIASYQDLLPEPSDHAEIIRLVAPDYHPEAIEFTLSDVLGGDDPIELQPFDTVRILGRYEADPPNVFVFGQVLRPGKYPLTRGMTAAGLVRMAGGFKRSALTREADVTSYVVRNGSTITTKNITLEIGKALGGDGEADLALKPNDVLTVRQLTGWNDIGASITITGQVVYPGTYGIEDGEKLSALLKRAGGFRGNAYPEGAVFERRQVRELSEKTRTRLIASIEAAGTTVKFSPTSSGQDQSALLQARAQQQQQILTVLKNQPSSGRLVIRISSDIERWQNTVRDIELRAGDVIAIPKTPSFVLVSGQVYDAAALTCTPGKNAGWYLRQAGGPTESANRKQIYVIRADGSVVGNGGRASLWAGSVLTTPLHCGDTVVVPEKIIGGTSVWKNVLDTAQLSSSLAIAAKVAISF